jgi:Tfp pilus assembly protein FimT
MYDQRPFAPLYGPSSGGGAGTFTASLTLTGSNSAATSGVLPGNVTGNSDINQIQISNTTTAWAYVNVGRNTTEVVAATVAASYPVAPTGIQIITVSSEVAAVSVILGTAPGTNTAVIFTRGAGID